MTNIHITKEVIETYRTLRTIFNNDEEMAWEPKGRRRAYLNADVALDRLLRRKSWQPDLVQTFGHDSPPPWYQRDAQIKAWHEMHALRVELDRTIGVEP
jgi:hypothetical protein